MKHLFALLAQRSRRFIVIVGLALVAFIAFVDTSTGPELAFYVFYFAPVALVSWFAGRWAGVLVAGVSAVAWSTSFLLAGGHYSTQLVLAWNVTIRCVSFLVIAELTSALGREYEQVRETSRTDFLTGLLNKRACYQTGETERLRCERYERPFSVAYIDLDNFKDVNDRLGHDAGDRLLIAVAHSFRRGLRRTDIVARVGGDEFLVLLPESDFGSTERVLTKLRDAVRQEAEQGGWPVTLSIGAAVFPVVADSLEAMVQCADSVMYAVKQGGRNNIKLQLVDASAQASAGARS